MREVSDAKLSTFKHSANIYESSFVCIADVDVRLETQGISYKYTVEKAGKRSTCLVDPREVSVNLEIKPSTMTGGTADNFPVNSSLVIFLCSTARRNANIAEM